MFPYLLTPGYLYFLGDLHVLSGLHILAASTPLGSLYTPQWSLLSSVASVDSSARSSNVAVTFPVSLITLVKTILHVQWLVHTDCNPDSPPLRLRRCGIYYVHF